MEDRLNCAPAEQKMPRTLLYILFGGIQQSSQPVRRSGLVTAHAVCLAKGGCV